MRVAAVLAASLTVAAAVSVTACQSGSKSAAGVASTAAGASAAAATSAAAAGGSGSSGSVTNFNVCKALSAAAVSQITGTTFTTVKPNSVAGQIFGCDYQNGDSALLQVSVSTQNGKGDFDADVSALKTVGFPPNPVTGVGDEAFSMPDPNGNAGAIGASSVASYGAVFGVTYIKIGGLTYVTADQGKRLVEELHGKL
jgi:hypothetical protein